MKEIFERVSIRKYKDMPLEKEKIEQILKAAMAAPSAGNQQPWEFYVVTNREKIQELSETHRYSSCAANAPVVLVPVYKTTEIWLPDYAPVDLAIACENILLEITALGLGGVWLGIYPQMERVEKVDKILNLEEGKHAFALIPFGYPAESREQQDRFDENRIHYLD
ncbi:MAG: nitroreductase family protein [Oscillospiraceae bacterium]|nr:nitroreductase family protein [Oscillospiraceae bacterium]